MSASAVSTVPRARSPILGRASELDETTSLLAEHRLVTLFGPGGAGKTRMAIEVAALREPIDRVYFVDLTQLTDDSRVAYALAGSMQVDVDVREPIVPQICRGVQDRTGLLVVDNCEHVIDAVADALDVLLDDCPQMRVLATSRELLSIAGERPVLIGSLSTAYQDSHEPGPAVELFLQRWRGAPDQPADEIIEQVTEICERLDGLPLAIELAAGRAASLGPEELLNRLDQRFALLTGRRLERGRVRTLEATVAWSYDLLHEDARRALRALSVPAATFDLRLATGLLDVSEFEALKLLEDLVVRSLVVVEPGPDHHRFRLLETIRQYAAERLVREGEAPDVRRRHVQTLANIIEEETRGTGGFGVGTSLYLEEDLHVAVQWARDRGDRSLAAPILMEAIHRVATQRSYDHAEELLEWFSQADDLDDVQQRAVVLRVTTLMQIWKLDFVTATGTAMELSRIEGHPEAAAVGWAMAALLTSVLDGDTYEVQRDGAMAALQHSDIDPDSTWVPEARTWIRWADVVMAIGNRDDERARALVDVSDREPVRTGEESLMIVQSRWALNAFLGPAGGPSPIDAVDLPGLDDLQPGNDQWLVPILLARAASTAATDGPERARERIARIMAHRPLPPARGTEEEALVMLAVCCLHAGESDRALQILEEGVTVTRFPTTTAIAIRMIGELSGVLDEQWEQWRVAKLLSWTPIRHAPDVHDKAKRMLVDELERLGLSAT